MNQYWWGNIYKYLLFLLNLPKIKLRKTYLHCSITLNCLMDHPRFEKYIYPRFMDINMFWLWFRFSGFLTGLKLSFVGEVLPLLYKKKIALEKIILQTS